MTRIETSRTNPASQPLVVLHAGSLQEDRVWTHVVSELEHDVNALIVERSTCSSPEATEDAAIHTIKAIDNKCAGSQLVLVGWELGNVIMRSIAMHHPERLAGLVLIDPAPVAGSGWDSEITIPPSIPITVILPGTQPDASNAANRGRQRLQREELYHFENLREIIAGRSGPNIPADRPDVIVNAIQHYFSTNH